MLKRIGYSLFFTLLAFLIHGYSFGLGDQAIHIPLIKKIINPSLYPQDILFLAEQSRFSLFYPVMAFIASHTLADLETIFFIGYFLSIIIFFFVLYALGEKILISNLLVFILLGLFFLIPFPIAGSAIYSVATSFVPRWLAFIFSIAGVYFIVSDNLLLLSLLLPLIFAWHPLTFIHFFVIIVTYFLLAGKGLKSRDIIIFVLFFILINLSNFINIWAKFSQTLFFQQVDDIWLTILRRRNSYAFIDLWPLKAWLSLALIVLPNIVYLIFYRRRKDNVYLFISAVLVAAVIVTVFQYLFATIFSLPFVISLQLSRIWIFAFFSAALTLSKIISQQKKELQQYIVALLIIIIILINGSWRKWYIKPPQSWIGAQLWARSHTSAACIFLTPLFSQGFRSFSERPVVAEYKDGTLSFYSLLFAKEWDQRVKDLRNWEDFSLNKLIKLQQKYHFSFLVSKKNIPLANIVYQNGTYKVYQIPGKVMNCQVNADGLRAVSGKHG